MGKFDKMGHGEKARLAGKFPPCNTKQASGNQCNSFNLRFWQGGMAGVGSSKVFSARKREKIGVRYVRKPYHFLPWRRQKKLCLLLTSLGFIDRSMNPFKKAFWV